MITGCTTLMVWVEPFPFILLVIVNVPGFFGVKLMDFPVTALENPCHCTISLGRRSGNIILSTVAVIGLPTLGVPLTVKLLLLYFIHYNILTFSLNYRGYFILS
ncbi:hypothetical protein [Chryseobacterium indologenes]|uniref:hypothetical protein n=1 Tax=Chryseobacterium indologenes TaxID=253 RepID=UPI00124AE805|nr:hypothetical protein [Chryseobacterium indologenes]